MADFCSSSISASPPPEIRVLSRQTLVPSSPTPRHAFFLSCFDVLWRDIHYNRRLLFYEPPSPLSASCDSSFSPSIIQQLKHSLSLCLVHYFPWCGRLAKGVDPPHRLFIDCNDAGVEFVEAAIDMPLSLLARDGFQMKPFFEQLCQMPDHKGDCLFSSPLLSIQVTTFSDGGFALGITQSHIVADGHSLWNFMVSWSECSRGVPLSVPPLHDRQRLALQDPSPEKASLWNLILPPKEEDIEEGEADSAVSKDKEKDTAVSKDKEKDNLETPPSSNGHEKSAAGINSSTNTDEGRHSETINASSDGKPDPLVQCAFDLSSAAVKKLKNEAGEGFTSYEVICAHFWQRTTAARQSPKHNKTYFTVLANGRNRVTPPLPPAYFGNVISFALVFSRVGKIGNETLRATANRVHELIVQVQDDLINFMHYLETNSSSLMSLLRSMPRGKGHNVASSPRFPVYQVDFGWGKPIAARAAKVVGEGEIVLFGGRPTCQGDVEICTALPVSVLERLLEDPEFLPKLPSNRVYQSN